MTDNIVHLHGRPREVAQVTRIGFFEHRKCEHLLSANKLAPRRFVIEAANAVDRQAGLLRAVEALSNMPESLRMEGFLHDNLEDRMNEAQRATRLKNVDDEARKKIAETAKRLAMLNDALRGLYKREEQPNFAPEARLRSAAPDQGHASRSSRP